MPLDFLDTIVGVPRLLFQRLMIRKSNGQRLIHVRIDTCDVCQMNTQSSTLKSHSKWYRNALTRICRLLVRLPSPLWPKGGEHFARFRAPSMLSFPKNEAFPFFRPPCDPVHNYRNNPILHSRDLASFPITVQCRSFRNAVRFGMPCVSSIQWSGHNCLTALTPRYSQNLFETSQRTSETGENYLRPQPSLGKPDLVGGGSWTRIFWTVVSTEDVGFKITPIWIPRGYCILRPRSPG